MAIQGTLFDHGHVPEEISLSIQKSGTLRLSAKAKLDLLMLKSTEEISTVGIGLVQNSSMIPSDKIRHNNNLRVLQDTLL